MCSIENVKAFADGYTIHNMFMSVWPVIYIKFANLQAHAFSTLLKCALSLAIFHFRTSSLQTNSTVDIT